MVGAKVGDVRACAGRAFQAVEILGFDSKPNVGPLADFEQSYSASALACLLKADGQWAGAVTWLVASRRSPGEMAQCLGLVC